MMVDGGWWQGIVVNVETSNCILDKFWIALRGAKCRTGDWKKKQRAQRWFQVFYPEQLDQEWKYQLLIKWNENL